MSDGAQLQNDQQVCQDYQDQDRCDVEDHLEIPNSIQPMNKPLQIMWPLAAGLNN